MAEAVKKEYKDKIVGILQVLFPQAKIYLFGSRARGIHAEKSDIDIAIDNTSPIELYAINEARSMLSESNIPYEIDIVDVRNVSSQVVEMILSEGIRWK